MKTKNVDDRGFRCECGIYYTHPAYVFAHWNIELKHTCPKCGRKHSIVCGIADLISTPEQKEVTVKN